MHLGHLVGRVVDQDVDAPSCSTAVSMIFWQVSSLRISPGQRMALRPSTSTRPTVSSASGFFGLQVAEHNSFPHRRVQLTADECYCSGSASGSCCSLARCAWSRIRLPTTRVKATLMTRPAITTPPAMSPIIAGPSGLFRTIPLR